MIEEVGEWIESVQHAKIFLEKVRLKAGFGRRGGGGGGGITNMLRETNPGSGASREK